MTTRQTKKMPFDVFYPKKQAKEKNRKAGSEKYATFVVMKKG